MLNCDLVGQAFLPVAFCSQNIRAFSRVGEAEQIAWAGVGTKQRQAGMPVPRDWITRTPPQERPL